MKSESWLRELDQTTKFKDIILFSQCQNLLIKKQLEMGIYLCLFIVN